MTFFNPRLEILPSPQRALWDELHQTPEHFTWLFADFSG